MKDRLLIGLGALTGSLVGGVTAYFFSPKSGLELQDDLVRLGIELERKALKGTISGLKTFESTLIKIGPIN